MQAVLTRNLSKKYHAVTALEDVNLTVEQGEIFGLLGPNGAGKSTLMKILTGFTLPTKGTATILGYDVLTETAKVRQNIGYSPQGITVDDHLTAKENLILTGSLYHVPNGTLKKRADELLSMVELDKRANDVAGTYSGGMKKKLDITLALVNRPKLLLL